MHPYAKLFLRSKTVYTSVHLNIGVSGVSGYMKLIDISAHIQVNILFATLWMASVIFAQSIAVSSAEFM
jgi:hypothetical protein